MKKDTYQFRKGDDLDEAGLFHDPAALSEAEFIRALFRRYLETGSVVRLKAVVFHGIGTPLRG